MSGTYSPNPALQFLDNNGDPAASYQLFTYLAGTSTKTSTYTDVNLQTANANPIVLDANGRCTIFLEPGVSYKFALATDTDTDPPASPVWTRDNISGVPESNVNNTVAGTAGEALAANDCVYLSAGDGSRTAGRWYKTDADNDYSSSTADCYRVYPRGHRERVVGDNRPRREADGILRHHRRDGLLHLRHGRGDHEHGSDEAASGRGC